MSQEDQRYWYDAVRARQQALQEQSRSQEMGMQGNSQSPQIIQQQQLQAEAAERSRQEQAQAAMNLLDMMSNMQQNIGALRDQGRNMPNTQLPSSPVPSGTSAQHQTETPVSEPARNALLRSIDQRHQRWKATWCPRVISGCSIVPDGARDELKQWTRNATKQRQIDRIGRLLDCYDGCVMALPRNEQKVGQCRVQCKNTIQ
jgi:hypothetical protein